MAYHDRSPSGTARLKASKWREWGEGWDPTVSSEPRLHGLHYLIRLHLLRSKHLLNSATLSFKTRAFGNI